MPNAKALVPETMRGGLVQIPRSFFHAHQLEIARHPARYKVIAAGRRFGKSKLLSMIGTIVALRGGRVWWIAPSYKLSLIGCRNLMQLARRIGGAQVWGRGMHIEYPSGGSITIRSAHDPESLRSEGLDLALFDEAAFINLKVAWLHAIRPALMDRGGWAVFASTPFGQNEFWKYWKRGLNPAPDSAWKSWRFSSWANPFLPAQEREQMAEEYADRDDAGIARQETEAEFLADSAGVFRGIDACLRDDLVLDRLPHPGCHHAIGWDPAKFEDYNAVGVADLDCRELVVMERTTRRDLMVQLDRVQTLAAKYHATVWMDTTRDETLFELALSRGLAVEPIRFTAALKQDMVNRTASVIERGRFGIPAEGTGFLVEELRGYRYQLSKWGGGVKYGAPAGEHDDTVTMLGLLVLAMGDAALRDSVIPASQIITSVGHTDWGTSKRPF